MSYTSIQNSIFTRNSPMYGFVIVSRNYTTLMFYKNGMTYVYLVGLGFIRQSSQIKCMF